MLPISLLFQFTLVSTLVLTAQPWGKSDKGREPSPFRVGVMEPVTGLGETYGTVANRAKQMAADEINAAGGISYSFDANGEVVGLSRVVVEVWPTAERTPERKYRVLGPAPGS